MNHLLSFAGNSAVIAAAGLLWLIVMYRSYGRFIERKLLRPDDETVTPAHRMRDNIDFTPAHPLVLFGHHFSSIAGAGPIIGPVIAVAAFGLAPALLWILLGVVFVGGVHDYTTAMLSVRHDGASVPAITRQLLGPLPRTLFLVFVLITLVFIVAVFLITAARTFIDDPRCVIPALGIIPLASLFGIATHRMRMPLLPATIAALIALAALLFLGGRYPLALPLHPDAALQVWIGVLAVYGACAAVLPVWVLLQPRDYLAAWILAAGMLVGFVGLFITHPPIQAPVFTSTDSASGPMWPMLFVLVACGAVSGFHSLVASGTTSKQLDRESHVRPVVFGAMLTEGALALMAALAVAAGIAFSGTDGSLAGFMAGARANPIGAFAAGYGTFTAPIFGSFGALFAVVMINSFVLTTLDTSVRLGRFIVHELGNDAFFLVRNRLSATLLIVVAAWILASTGNVWTLWQMFGASNQLVAALALIVVTAWLVRHRRPSIYTLIPAVFMLVTTVAALVYQGHAFLFGAHPSIALAAASGALILLGLFVAIRGAITILKHD